MSGSHTTTFLSCNRWALYFTDEVFHSSLILYILSTIYLERIVAEGPGGCQHPHHPPHPVHGDEAPGLLDPLLLLELAGLVVVAHGHGEAAVVGEHGAAVPHVGHPHAAAVVDGEDQGGAWQQSSSISA